jgi:putative acetyltransferase
MWAPPAGPEAPDSATLAPVDLEITVDDPRAADVRELLAAHRAFARAVTPAEYSFALDVDELAEPDVTFFSARSNGWLVGVAALKELDDVHAEIKSMHTRQTRRGRGVGRALVRHLLDHARAAGYRRVSLETGTTDDFIPARTLYEGAGFEPCGPFGDYASSPYNTFMTITLE